MYKVLGLEGPYQSICSGRTDCAVDLAERSSTTLDSLKNEPEFEGIGFESKIQIQNLKFNNNGNNSYEIKPKTYNMKD